MILLPTNGRRIRDILFVGVGLEAGLPNTEPKVGLTSIQRLLSVIETPWKLYPLPTVYPALAVMAIRTANPSPIRFLGLSCVTP